MPGARAPAPPSTNDENQLGARAPVLSSTSDEKRFVSKVAIVVMCCCLNSCVSAALISFNKYLMHEHRFPYAFHLVAVHCVVSSALIIGFWLLLRTCGYVDSMFSALPDVIALDDVSRNGLRMRIVVIATFYVCQLILSNIAYMYSSMAFIQMLKEANLVFVYVLSVVVALENLHIHRGQVLIFIFFATLLTIRGEVHFTWHGFAVQASGQFFEVIRIVLQALLLSGSFLHLDVLSYVLLVMPVCSVLLVSVLTFNHCLSHPIIAEPTRAAMLDWWPQLLANATLAFALNITTAIVVKRATAVGMILAGVVKDTSIIVVGACLFQEHISRLQAIGFAMQVSGITIYSLLKLNPDAFKFGLVHGIKTLTGVQVQSALKDPAACAKLYGASPSMSA